MKKRDIHKWAYHRKPKENVPLWEKIIAGIILFIIAAIAIYFVGGIILFEIITRLN